MTAPRISVLMPCYNHGAFIDEAVESVFAQTVQDFEILIVDDGSTDPETAAKLRGYKAPRTTVFHTANQGLPAARNYAASHAAGSVFCALDADDRLAPTWFEKGLAVLDAQPEIAFVSHWLETFGDEHWVWQPERCDLASLLAHNTVNGAALVRRPVFEAVGGYEESMRGGCEDWDFWLRVVEAGHEGTIIPEVLFYYRRRAESMSRVMAADVGYPRPLETLLARHTSQYRSHVIDLLVMRESESLHLRAETARLERDRLTILAPQVARAREELRAVSSAAETAGPHVQAASERRALEAQAAELERERARLAAEEDRLARELAASRNEADALGHEIGRLRDERHHLLLDRDGLAQDRHGLVETRERLERELGQVNAHAADLKTRIVDLEASWSWRLTTPLRWAAGLLKGDR